MLGTQVASLGVDSVTLKSRGTGTGTEPMSVRCFELLNNCPDVIWCGGGRGAERRFSEESVCSLVPCVGCGVWYLAFG